MITKQSKIEFREKYKHLFFKGDHITIARLARDELGYSKKTASRRIYLRILFADKKYGEI